MSKKEGKGEREGEEKEKKSERSRGGRLGTTAYKSGLPRSKNRKVLQDQNNQKVCVCNSTKLLKKIFWNKGQESVLGCTNNVAWKYCLETL